VGGEKQRLFLTLGTQLLGFRPPLLSPLPALPELPLRRHVPRVFLSGTSLSTSVVEREPSTAWLHLSSARRPRILNWLFPLPLSCHTSAHMTGPCNALNPSKLSCVGGTEPPTVLHGTFHY